MSPDALTKGAEMNIARIWALTQIVVRAHILNWLWRPRAVRSEIRCDVFSDVAVRYFKRYLPAVEKVKEIVQSLKVNNLPVSMT